jgi:hypothetical protein
MTRWLALAVLCLAVSARAEEGAPPRRGPPPGMRGGPGGPGGPGAMLRDMTPEDQKAIHDFKLTAENTGKLMDAHKRFRELHEKDPEMMKGQNPMAVKTIDESIKRVEAAPEKAKAILKQVGLQPREFVVGTFTMMTSAIWSGMRQHMPQAQPPPYVNPDNVAFVDAHPELLEQFKQMGPPHGGPHAEHGN